MWMNLRSWDQVFVFVFVNNLDLQVIQILSTKFLSHLAFRFRKKVQIRFSRWPPPSWNSDRNNFSYFSSPVRKCRKSFCTPSALASELTKKCYVKGFKTFSNTPARVVPICLYISSRALSRAFEHRNFVARYQRETNLLKQITILLRKLRLW